MGIAESTESTLAGEGSTLKLPVAAVKVYFEWSSVGHTASPKRSGVTLAGV